MTDMKENSSTINADGFEPKSANQLYKESNSKKPFKEWLVEQQEKGMLNDVAQPQYTPYSPLTGGAGAGATAGAGAGKTKEKKPVNAEAITSGIGAGINLVSDIVKMVKDNKDQKRQDKLDQQMAGIRDADIRTPTPTASAVGVPVAVWYGVGAVTVLIVGYFVYKNFIATDSAAPVAAPVAK
jgi:hypothetical protein